MKIGSDTRSKIIDIEILKMGFSGKQAGVIRKKKVK